MPRLGTCGHEVGERDQFCPSCGRQLTDAVGGEQSVPAAAAVDAPVGSSADGGSLGADGGSWWARASGGQRWSLVAGGLAMVAGAVWVVALFAQHADPAGSGQEFHGPRVGAAAFLVGGLLVGLIGWAVLGDPPQRSRRLLRAGVIGGAAMLVAVFAVSAMNGTDATPRVAEVAAQPHIDPANAPSARAAQCGLAVTDALDRALDARDAGEQFTGLDLGFSAQSDEYQIFLNLYNTIMNDYATSGMGSARGHAALQAILACKAEFPR